MARIVSAPYPRPCPDVIKAARLRVKKAMASRALAVAAQCRIVVDALAALEKLQREVEEVDLEGCSCYCAAGEIGVLSNHIPMILSLKFGLIKLFSDDGKMLASFYLDSGVAKISSLDVNILCGQCCDAANIDEAYLHKQIDLLSKPDNKNSKLEFYKNILAVI
jgi:F-type H+-transporting ATPase subunit epsilon